MSAPGGRFAHRSRCLANTLGDGARIHEVVALIAGFDLDLGIRTWHAVLRTAFHQRINAGETVAP